MKNAVTGWELGTPGDQRTEAGSTQGGQIMSRRTCLRVADTRTVLSRVQVTTTKTGDPGKVWEAPSGPAPAAPSLTSAYSALLALLLPQTNAPGPRNDTAALHQSTEPVPQAGRGPAPKHGPRTRSGAAIFYNCPMEAASVARGRSGLRLEPILSG